MFLNIIEVVVYGHMQILHDRDKVRLILRIDDPVSYEEIQDDGSTGRLVKSSFLNSEEHIFSTTFFTGTSSNP